jgi:hypothetical protein
MANATPFGNFHDRAVFHLINQRRVALKNAKWSGSRRRWNPAQQRKHNQRTS